MTNLEKKNELTAYLANCRHELEYYQHHSKAAQWKIESEIHSYERQIAYATAEIERLDKLSPSLNHERYFQYAADNITTIPQLATYINDHLEAFDREPEDLYDIVKAHGWLLPYDTDHEPVTADPNTCESIEYGLGYFSSVHIEDYSDNPDDLSQLYITNK